MLVWGAGGHGRVVAELARALGYEVTGYIDAKPSKPGTHVDSAGGEVVIVEEAFLEGLARPGSASEGKAVALGIGDNEMRLRCLERLANREVITLVHPSATVSPSVEIGIGTVVMPGAVINANARIGRAVIVNSGAIVEHDCVLHNGVHVSPAAVLAGGVKVEARSWVGAGAVVLNGLVVEAAARVGAGAVVTKRVDAGCTVVGVPARPLTGGSTHGR